MDILQPENTPQVKQYAQAIRLPPGGERLIMSGQIGLLPDGTVCDGMEAQMEQAWRNLLNTMDAAGFAREHLTRVFVFVTKPDQLVLYRAVRDRMLEGHLCATTYLEISGLATPELLVEIEGEAQKPA